MYKIDPGGVKIIVVVLHESSKRPAGDLFVLLHVFPGLPLTAVVISM
jgi:hypothetical protein